jgi:hypothetical protein
VKLHPDTHSANGATCFEFLAVISLFSGLVVGCIVGYQKFGTVGAIIGVPLGAVGGILLWGLLGLILAVVMCIADGEPLFSRKQTKSPDAATNNDEPKP